METSINSSTSIENDVCTGIILHGTNILEHCVVPNDVLSKYKNRIEEERLDYSLPKNLINPENWFIPEQYKNLDIEQFLVSQCPAENYNRLETELVLFKKHKMIMMLKTMKYLVDSMRSNQIVWGVGRGSSVASYALFLIGIHKIDSVKYNLPIEEFFKGE